MRREFNHVPVHKRPSFALREMGSHSTILKPRESPSAASSAFASLMNENYQENETRLQRAKLIFRILCYCLGPGNIWRFPQQSFAYGKATYVYAYMMYSWIFGVSLLVFEISLSQYFVNGFAKIFNLCPVMEGITLSMVFYCTMASLLYSMVCVYSVLYLVTGLRDFMPHSYCSKYVKGYDCKNDSVTQNNTPEYVFFFNYVEQAVIDYGDEYNLRNMFILCIIWSILCIIVVLGLLKYHWIAVALSSVIFFVLLSVAIISVTLNGARDGLLYMFAPNANDISQLTTWVYPLEQCVVSLGVGAGPLTTIWSITKIKYWSHTDCVIVNIIAFSCSLLSGIAFFSSAGVVVSKKNATLEGYIKNDPKATSFIILFFYVTETHIHILLTQMFNSLKHGVSNSILIFYYLILFCSCCYSLLEYIQILLIYISSYITCKKSLRLIIIIGICSFLYLTTNLGVSKVGYSVISAINKNFIATALLLIIFFELVTVSYLYGLRNFCDDIEFMLGFTPNYYFQVTWFLLPPIFGVFSVMSLYLKFRDMENYYDLVVLCLILLLIVGPVITRAAYKCYVGIRDMGIRRFLNPRLHEGDWDNTPASEISRLSGFTHYSSLYNTLYSSHYN